MGILIGVEYDGFRRFVFSLNLSFKMVCTKKEDYLKALKEERCSLPRIFRNSKLFLTSDK
jgi:membrane-bound lytic murein transglycosylase MltF